MLQYKIPQNVGIEDKIVGPFSLRQLIILAIGGGISYVLFAITSRIYELNILEYILIALPALFALAMAMIRIHNVSFGKYILLTLEFAIKPKKRLWDHRGISALVAPDLSEKKGKKVEVKEVEAKKNVNLSDLSATLDSGGFEHIEKVAHEDIDEANDDDLITEAYFGHKKQESDTENMYWRTRDMQKKKLDLLAKMNPAQPAAVPAAVSPAAPTSSAPVAPVEPEPMPAPPTSEPVPAPKMPESSKAPEKKESVTQHLANVIKEARQNNQKKEEVEEAAPAKVEQTAPKVPSEPSDQAEQPKKKRKRRRRRKKKTGAGPVRQNTQVNTTSKSQPNKLIKKSEKHEGETSFNDLSEGNEIEFNLD